MNRRQILQSLSAACVLVGAAGLSACQSQRAQSSLARDDFRTRLPEPWRSQVMDPALQFRLRWTAFDPRRTRWSDGVLTQSEGLADQTWFAPGSWVKLPLALMALEQIEAAGLGLDARIELSEPPVSGEWSIQEPSTEGFLKTLRRVFVVSDNVAANRLYEFLGQDVIHQRLAELGYPNARIVSRMGSPNPNLNRQSVAVVLRNAVGGVRLTIPQRVSRTIRRFPHGAALAGRGWFDGQQIVSGAHDFSESNYLDIADMHQMLLALICPEAVPAAQRWQISEASRLAVLTEMARWPAESPDPPYSPEAFPANYAKFLLPNGVQRGHVRLYGKSGQAYGYLNDAEALLNTETGTLMVVSTSIYVNADGVLNDDAYDYEQVALPVFSAIADRFC
ncbi:serine hydrolase [Ahniella affigens]|nr:serine hydrolase [Ahniella affigens]